MGEFPSHLGVGKATIQKHKQQANTMSKAQTNWKKYLQLMSQKVQIANIKRAIRKKTTNLV